MLWVLTELLSLCDVAKNWTVSCNLPSTAHIVFAMRHHCFAWDLQLCIFPPVLWHCWLGSRKGIRPVKTEWWDTGVVMCLERGADLHIGQLMPLPLTIFCSSKSRLVFTFLVLAHPAPGSPVQRAMCCCYFCCCCCCCYCCCLIKWWTFDYLICRLMWE